MNKSPVDSGLSEGCPSLSYYLQKKYELFRSLEDMKVDFPSSFPKRWEAHRK